MCTDSGSDLALGPSRYTQLHASRPGTFWAPPQQPQPLHAQLRLPLNIHIRAALMARKSLGLPRRSTYALLSTVAKLTCRRRPRGTPYAAERHACQHEANEPAGVATGATDAFPLTRWAPGAARLRRAAPPMAACAAAATFAASPRRQRRWGFCRDCGPGRGCMPRMRCAVRPTGDPAADAWRTGNSCTPAGAGRRLRRRGLQPWKTPERATHEARGARSRHNHTHGCKRPAFRPARPPR